MADRMADKAESCTGVLGCMLRLGLCKLVGDKLSKAEEEQEVVRKALCKDVLVEAN